MAREGLLMDSRRLEADLGFAVPAGVEVREDATGDLVYVYADPLGDKAVAVLSGAAATPKVLGAAIRKAAEVVIDDLADALLGLDGGPRA